MAKTYVSGNTRMGSVDNHLASVHGTRMDSHQKSTSRQEVNTSGKCKVD